MTTPQRPTRQVVLLDLDGTLSESAPGILGSLTIALQTLGLTVPAYDVMHHAVGPPFEVGLPEIGVPVERVVEVIAEYRKVYEVTGLFETRLYDGIVEMIDALTEAGCTLAIATSKPERSALRVIEHLGLAGRFEFVGGATHDALRSTKAEVVGYVLDRLGLIGGPELVMVGDRNHDIEGAGHHGIDTIAVGWGYGSLEEHETAGAWSIAQTPADVVRLVVGDVPSQ